MNENRNTIHIKVEIMSYIHKTVFSIMCDIEIGLKVVFLCNLSIRCNIYRQNVQKFFPEI